MKTLIGRNGISSTHPAIKRRSELGAREPLVRFVHQNKRLVAVYTHFIVIMDCVYDTMSLGFDAHEVGLGP